MSLFLVLLQKLVPLYLLILLGFVANRVLVVKKEAIASLLIYIIAPAVVFTSLLNTPLTLSRLSLPFFFFFLSSSMGLGVFFGTRRLLPPAHRSIMAFASGSANAGFFGIPVTIFLFGPQYLGLAVLCSAGFVTYENSLGFYLAARGRHTARQAFFQVLRLPTVYAVVLGILLRFQGVKLSGPFEELANNLRGAYIVLGMLIVGLAVSSFRRLRVNKRFFLLAFAIKFVLWPAIVFSFLYFDAHTLHFYDSSSRRIMRLMSILPMPAITVAIATALNTEPEETALLVLAGTLFGLVYIPLLGGLLG